MILSSRNRTIFQIISPRPCPYPETRTFSVLMLVTQPQPIMKFFSICTCFKSDTKITVKIYPSSKNMQWCLIMMRGKLSNSGCRSDKGAFGWRCRSQGDCIPVNHSCRRGRGQGGRWCLPEGGAFGPRDFQKVVTILQLEVNEDQSNGVSQLGQDGPCAISIVMILRGKVGAGDDAALAPQGTATGIVRCGQETRGYCELVQFAGPGTHCAPHCEN